MKYILVVVTLFLFVKNNYSNDFPWKNIGIVRIKVEINYSPHLCLNKLCHCNCDSGKSIGCSFNSFTLKSWDADTCFWINLFNTSNPKLKERGPVAILGCGPPSRSFQIEIIANKKDSLTIHFNGIVPNSFSMFTNNDLNNEWFFSLNEDQVKLLSKRLEMITKCGTDELLSQLNNKPCGCN
jgi:hypothetical protein